MYRGYAYQLKGTQFRHECHVTTDHLGEIDCGEIGSVRSEAAPSVANECSHTLHFLQSFQGLLTHLLPLLWVKLVFIIF